ncbi:hypothetical protein A5724_23665 [Mycobacterium sp. ACS1612]|uniref:ESX secretion-associated protein EspG n=1 Tax=Mycobacterium sp. ACS1612 TaxID=1834117 RepID=UPI0007FB8210|nr:ESX secretion-associated protein EspG [Mycobacterium sp. ACS1612]OBF30224.1 hypothetical protein A5724_23665 [Mycobacterium sp. ACS1612]
MTSALSDRISLSHDELQAVAGLLGVFDLPSVLNVRPRYATIPDRDAAVERAKRNLLARNLITDRAVHLGLAAMLETLHRPDLQWAIRMVTPEGTARVAVARRGATAVVARRISEVVTLSPLRDGAESLSMAKALASELRSADAAPVEPFAAPLQQLAECLSGTDDPVALADQIRSLGAETSVALSLGAALASRQAFAEIVVYALVADEDRICRAPAAAGVFYTRRGRIVAVPSASPTGEIWTTVKGGTDHAVIQAITRLAELTTAGGGDG